MCMKRHIQKSKQFRASVLEYWRVEGRHHLPWRKTRDPYHILVSEMMLQQTQVDRVIPKFYAFIEKFPTVQDLEKSAFADVLALWSGLGYNRRAKFLHECARILIEKHGGVVPKDKETLLSLPGVGEYTASAIGVFAYNRKEVLIETNIRTALIHFFPQRKKVPDSKLAAILEEMLPEIISARKWYSALMDYGAHIKRVHGNASRRSSGYKKQSRFKGSIRQVRGAVLKELQKDRPKITALPFAKEKIERAVAGLQRDALITTQRGKLRIA